MKNIEQIIKDINEQTDAIYEGMCENSKVEVLDAIRELRIILNQIENEIN
jgi:methyl-accepting chemotaxis protein